MLLQLGTPDAPTAQALRPYLRQFLGDPRILEMPAWKRWLLVNGIIVPFRSPRSAIKYRRIWDAQTGSPLLSITRRQAEALQNRLGNGFRVRFAMRYGNPSIQSVIRELCSTGCEKLLAVPMYPQYSATTSGSSIDAIFDALKKERIIPSVRVVATYHDEGPYVDSVAHAIERADRQARKEGIDPEIFVLSFHGIPKKYIDRGDPYQCQSTATAQMIAQRLGWKPEQWRLAFQSRLGREEWLTPYLDETLKELGREGIKRVLVASPGFTADCLETIDEIGYEGLLEFRSTGGEHLVRVPCVNDDPAFILALTKLVERETCGWG